jgi:hypothetical protein
MLASAIARLETPPIRSYATGIPQLDELIGGGICTRALTAINGIPGSGKSALAVAIALHIAATLPVLYASTELEAHEVMARFAGNVLDRPWSAIVRGGVPIAWVREAVDGRLLYVIGCEVMPREGAAALLLIEAQARLLTELHGIPPLVVVDYLQELARGSEHDLKARVGDIASHLRAMSQRLDGPMIGISSVSRLYYNPKKAAELREADDPTVYLGAAKESGDIEFAAAVVIFLDVDADDGMPSRPARIAVAKSRPGRTGFAGARFWGASGRWTADTEAVTALSAPGRAEGVTTDSRAEADTAVIGGVMRMHAEGKREICTQTQLKEGGWCGIGGGRIKPAIDRLVHAGRLRLVTIERLEGDPPKPHRRAILDLPPAPTGGVQ